MPGLNGNALVAHHRDGGADGLVHHAGGTFHRRCQVVTVRRRAMGTVSVDEVLKASSGKIP